MAAKPWQDHAGGLGITAPMVFHEHRGETSATGNLSLGILNERSGAGIDGQGHVVMQGLLLFGSGCVSAELKCLLNHIQ